MEHSNVEFLRAPLWPAGHLPLKGGRLDVTTAFRQLLTLQERAPSAKLLISPLEGEMAGRPEGGAVPPASQKFSSR
ncbi:MAG: hypothetical protein EOS40_28965 [Mesorhizobium sp.]|nr:MAG: hypothetical protein EOS40_28965 [Mesorhizobium sp.]TIS45132.1 MAG: hypothetical protein E5W96_33075 [Mesorhizobium sp.]